MLIDIHCHTSRTRDIFKARGTRYPDPGELIGMLDRACIDRAAILCSVSPERRYCLVTPEEVLSICAEYPQRLIPFCGIDPRMLTNSANADFGPLLRHYRSLGCRGIGEYQPGLALDDPLNLNFFRQAAEHRLPVTLHLASGFSGHHGCYDDPGLPRLEKILRALPDLVVIGHSQTFWVEISTPVTAADRDGFPRGPVTPGRVVELMRACPNLHADLSANSGYNAVSRDPEFTACFLEEFQDRLYFGTDISDVPRELPVVDWFLRLKEEKTISPGAWEKIAWKNATNLLGL